VHYVNEEVITFTLKQWSSDYAIHNTRDNKAVFQEYLNTGPLFSILTARISVGVISISLISFPEYEYYNEYCKCQLTHIATEMGGCELCATNLSCAESLQKLLVISETRSQNYEKS